MEERRPAGKVISPFHLFNLPASGYTRRALQLHPSYPQMENLFFFFLKRREVYSQDGVRYASPEKLPAPRSFLTLLYSLEERWWGRMGRRLPHSMGEAERVGGDCSKAS